MPQNPNGTAVCDRCSLALPGYGVLHGLISTYLDTAGDTVEQIFCYANGCREVALGAGVTSRGYALCAVDSTPVGNVAAGLLASDLNPDGSWTSRQFAFCHANGHDQAFLDRA